MKTIDTYSLLYRTIDKMIDLIISSINIIKVEDWKIKTWNNRSLLCRNINSLLALIHVQKKLKIEKQTFHRDDLIFQWIIINLIVSLWRHARDATLSSSSNLYFLHPPPRCYRFVCISTVKLNPFVRTWPSISLLVDNIHGNFPPVGHRFPRIR